MSPDLVLGRTDLAGAAVRDELAALAVGNVHHPAGDHRAGERGTEQVDALVDGVALDGRVDELVDKLGLQVLEEELGRADLERLGARGLEVLLLTDIGH